MTAFKEGGGTVPRGYAQLRGSIREIWLTSSDSAVCTAEFKFN
jgi:hypothetical protein